MTQRRRWVRAGIAVAVMVAIFPVETMVAALFGGWWRKLGDIFMGGLVGGIMLAYASLPLIATVVVLGSLPFLRPPTRLGRIGATLYVVLFGVAVGGVFAATLYNGGPTWRGMFVGPGLWFWVIAATAGFYVLWDPARVSRAGSHES